MIHKLCVFISDSMPDEIKLSSKTRDIYIYCLEQFFSQILFVILILTFGIITKEFLTSVMLLASMMPLRAYGGGTHAPSKSVCAILSYGVCIIAILLIPLVYHLIPTSLCLWIYFSCAVIIWILSPVTHKNKPLNNEKKKNLHNKCGVFTLMLTALILILFVSGYGKYVVTITLSVIIVCISSVIGHIQNRRG